MKQGRSIMELAAEIQRQSESKQDIVASTQRMKVYQNGDDLRLGVGDDYDYGINQTCHKQIANHTGIPAQYYDRMVREAPELLTNNVNTWFQQHPTPRMLRTLDGNGRALLSDKYRPLENSDLAEAVLPVLADIGAHVVSCQITDTRLYIKAVDKSIMRDIPKGHALGDGTHTIFDTVCPAISISNSEVGFGALTVDLGMLTSACTNLAFFEKAIRKTHLGAKHDLADGLYNLLSDQTQRITDAALWSQVRDVVSGSFAEAQFAVQVKKLTDTTADKIVGDPVKTVELSAKRYGLTDGERGGVLRHLVEGGDLSRYGLVNAVTRTAEDLDDYDRSSMFEKLGGKIVELPKNDWKVLAEAA